MKPFALGQKSWDKAQVTKRLHERSYEVQSRGTTFRRNRQHLVKTAKPTQFLFPLWQENCVTQNDHYYYMCNNDAAGYVTEKLQCLIHVCLHEDNSNFKT